MATLAAVCLALSFNDEALLNLPNPRTTRSDVETMHIPVLLLKKLKAQAHSCLCLNEKATDGRSLEISHQLD